MKNERDVKPRDVKPRDVKPFDYLKGGILWVDGSKESKEAIKLVRRVRPDILIEPAEQEHSDYRLPALMTGEGIVFQHLYKIRPHFRTLPDKEVGDD